MEASNQNLFDLQIDHQSNGYLGEAAKWGKFLSVLGFVFCGLLAIAALFAGSFMATLMQGRGLGTNEPAAAATAWGSGLITFVYLIIALVYFFPCLYLFQFSSKMQAALRANEQDVLNTSFRNLKSCFKFMGILMIILLSFWVLALIIGIGAAMTLAG